jgi:hypothetical protein
LEIEIADRKRTLSKYLNQKQVDKFMEMQNEYGGRKEGRPKQEGRPAPTLTPIPHPSSNEYELNRI